ncbi:hypothetical protein [Kribbella monticola]|uniref:hypothetical protein n=1 Tax=Kribbella monticola TaxID=2185285 RepID=UPI001300AF6D|nr:hypothetical protein [Kribbella monticola]
MSVATGTMRGMSNSTAMHLTSPVLEPVDPDHERLVAAARRALINGSAGGGASPPFTDEIRRAEQAVVRQLDRYDHLGYEDQLYVLEFQGMHQQYVMYGRTRSWWRRLLSHRQAAAPHGFALLNGWLSPKVSDAYPLEQIALAVAGALHGQEHFRERFYNMRFEDGLSVARAVFELSNHYPIKRRRPSGRDRLMSIIYKQHDERRSGRVVDLSDLAHQD